MAMVTCRREGCTREARTRGMCSSHYTVWRKQMKRKGLFTSPEPIEKRMLDAMPGTYEEIAKAAGHGYWWIQKQVDLLHKDGKAHVSGHQPPADSPGSRWRRIFTAGPGEDVVLTNEKKRKHALARRREREGLQKTRGKKPKDFTYDPVMTALYGGAPC
jgi:hypothetical protein